MIENWSNITGGANASYTLTVKADQENGTYKLASSASAFNNTITVKNQNGDILINTLTVDGSAQKANDKFYSLTHDNTDLVLTISGNVEPVAELEWSWKINADEKVEVSAGEGNSFSYSTGKAPTVWTSYTTPLQAINDKYYFKADNTDSTQIDIIGYVYQSSSEGGALRNTISTSFNNAYFLRNHATGAGGAICNDSSMTLNSAYFVRNSADYKGGAIYQGNGGAIMTLNNAVFSGNYASSYGGAIAQYTYMSLQDASFIENSASSGGAIYTPGGSMTLSNASFSGNSARNGGAIYNTYGSMMLSDASFSGNSAMSSGGAIYNYYGSMMLSSATFSGNNAGYGGAIYNRFGSMMLSSATFSKNSAMYGGGAIFNEYSNYLELSNISFFGNSAGKGGAIYNAGSMTLSNVSFSGNVPADAWGAVFNTGNGGFYLTDARFETASDTIYNEGNMTFSGMISLAGNLTTTKTITATGADMAFDISSYTEQNAISIISDISMISDVNSWAITVKSGQAVGQYKLASGASSFDKTITVKNTDGTVLAASLTVNGDTVRSGNRQYKLTRTDSDLFLNITKDPGEVDWSWKVNEDGKLELAVEDGYDLFYNTYSSSANWNKYTLPLDLINGGYALKAVSKSTSESIEMKILGKNGYVLRGSGFDNGYFVNCSSPNYPAYTFSASGNVSQAYFSRNSLALLILQNIPATLNNATFLGNGVAIRTATGVSATLDNALFSGNSAFSSSWPSPILNANNAILNISNTKILNNAGFGIYGAITNYGSMTLSNVTFSGNSNTSLDDPGMGGTIRNYGSMTLTDIETQTISDGIFNQGRMNFSGNITLAGKLINTASINASGANILLDISSWTEPATVVSGYVYGAGSWSVKVADDQVCGTYSLGSTSNYSTVTLKGENNRVYGNLLTGNDICVNDRKYSLNSSTGLAVDQYNTSLSFSGSPGAGLYVDADYYTTSEQWDSWEKLSGSIPIYNGTLYFKKIVSKNSGTETWYNTLYGYYNNSSVFNGGAINNTSGSQSLPYAYFIWNSTLADGGAVYNKDEMIFSSAVFSYNSANRGGAIYNAGSMTIGIPYKGNRSLYEHNSASYGGVVYNTGNMTLSSIYFADNSATYGGAIYNAGNMTLSNTYFADGNRAAFGGAIYNTGSVTLSSAYFGYNYAYTSSGADIYNVGGKVYLKDVQFSNYTSSIYTDSGTILFAGSNRLGAFSAVNNATVGFDISEQTQGNTDAIVNYLASTDFANYTITVNANQAFGYYTLIDSAYSFNSSISVKCGDITLIDSLTIGSEGKAAGERKYALTRNNDHLILSIFEYVKPVVTLDWTWNINADGKLEVSTDAGYSLYYNTDNSSNWTSYTSALTPIQGTYYFKAENDTGIAKNNIIGYVGQSASYGGAINNSGTMTLNNAYFRTNSATERGGAIFQKVGSLTFSSASFADNSASCQGGAIFNWDSAAMSIDSATFSKNSAENGGAIFNCGGTMTISSASFSGNLAYEGGAIHNGVSGTMTLSCATFSRNSAENGGAIKNGENGGSMTLSDVDFTGNTALFGGAIYNYGSMTLDSASFNENSASYSGGAIITTGGSMTLSSATFNRNSAAAGGAIYNRSYLTLSGASFSGNTASQGGAIYNSKGMLSLTNAKFETVSDTIYTDSGTMTFAGNNTLNAALTAVNNANIVFDISNLTTGNDIAVISDLSKVTGSVSYSILLDADQVYGNYKLAAGASSFTGSMSVKSEDSTLIETLTVDGEAVTVDNTFYALKHIDSDLVLTISDGAKPVVELDWSWTINANGKLEVATEEGYTLVYAMTAEPETWINYTTPLDPIQGTYYFKAENDTGIAKNNIIGYNKRSADYGAAIANSGSRTLSNAYFTSNRTRTDSLGYGGAILNTTTGNMVFGTAYFYGNSAGGSGGAIDNWGSMSFNSAVFKQNAQTEAGGPGGGAIYNSKGNIVFSTAEFYANSTKYSAGGAIYNTGSGNITLSSATFSGNSGVQGGAIYNVGNASMSLSNTVFTGNSATNGGAILNTAKMNFFNANFYQNYAISGGAINNNNGTITLSDCVFSGNSAAQSGGAIFNRTTATVNLTNVQFKTASDKINNAGEMNFSGTISLAGNLYTSSTISAAGANMVFDISSYDKGNTTTIISDISKISGADSWSITVNENQTIGSYKLAAGANSFEKTISVKCGDTILIPELTINGSSVTSGSKIYSLKRDNSNLVLSITEKSLVELDWTWTINANGNLEVSTDAGYSLYYNTDDSSNWTSYTSALTPIQGTYYFKAENDTSIAKNDIIGYVGQSASYGGAINNSGTMTLDNAYFLSNSASKQGGAIYNYYGSMTLSSATFSGNSGSQGGAIYNYYGSMTLSSATFSRNTVKDAGGAIYNYGRMTLSSATFSGNSAGNGAALWNYSSAVFSANDIIFSNNSATGWGGAICNNTANARLILSGGSFTSNYAAAGGGALHNHHCIISVDDMVFNGNRTNGTGGILYNADSGTVTIKNTVIQNNSAGNGTVYNNNASAYFENVSFTSNTANENAAIANDNKGVCRVSSAAFEKNQSVNSHGGAITNNGKSFELLNVSFTNNKAKTSGGAIITTGGSMTLSSATFNRNSAAAGGAIYNRSYLTLSGATFSGNTASQGGAIYNSIGMISLTNAKFETVSDTIYTDSGTMTFAGNNTLNATLTAVNNANIVFDISNLTTGNDIAVISDLSKVTGSVSYSILLDADQVYGNYKLASGASSFTGSMSVKSGDSTLIETLTVDGKTVTVDNTSYALKHDNSNLVLTISEYVKPLVDLDWSWNINADGKLEVATEEGYTLSYAMTAEPEIWINYTTPLDPIQGTYYFKAENDTGIAKNNIIGYVGQSASYGGAINNSGTMTLDNAYFLSNSASKQGGAIYNTGNLTINNAVFNKNIAQQKAGAIYNAAGSMTLSSASFIYNSAFSFDGGIHNEAAMTLGKATFSGNSGKAIYNGGSMTFDDAVFVENIGDLGGAIYNNGSVTLSSASFSGNSAVNGCGGAIYNNGSVTLSSASFNENSTHSGGAIFNDSGSMTLTSADFIGNAVSASGNSNFSAVGGAIFNSGSMTLDSATFSENSVSACATRDNVTAYAHGGAIYNTGSMTLTNTTFNENSAYAFTYTAAMARPEGGAIYNTGSMTFTNAAFSKNSAKNGGTIYNMKRMTFDSADFIGNSASYQGGAIYNDYAGSMTFSSATFSNNHASGSAGGCAGAIFNSGSMTFSSATFNGNSVSYSGGAICNVGNMTLDSATFSGNSATGTVANGGAILNVNSMRFGSALFNGNYAGYGGGAICNFGAFMAFFTSATFIGNSVKVNGGTIYNTGSMTFTNAAFSKNSAKNGGAFFNTGSMTIGSASFTGNAASSGGAIFNDSGSMMLGSTTFSGNSAANGGAIFNTGKITFANDLVLVTDSDTIVNSGTLNWNITGGTSSSAKLSGYDKLTNNGTLTITVNAAQSLGDYIIATGVSNTTGKNEFTLTGGTGEDVTITVGSGAKTYSGRSYSLAVTTDNSFVLSVQNPLISYELSDSVSTKYDGNAHSITVAADVSVKDAKYYYSLDNGSTWNDGNSYSLTDANTKNVCFKITAEGYSDTITDSRDITIGKRDVTLSSSNDSKKYDGTALEGTVTIGGDGFIAGEASVTAGSLTDAGTITNSITINESSAYKASNYNITKNEGTLTVSKRNVTLTSADDSKSYDGTPLTNHKITVSGDGFVTGESYTANVTGTQTDVGSSKNTFTYTLNEDTKAGNYNITTQEGVLTVTEDEVPKVKEVVITGDMAVVSWIPSSETAETDLALAKADSPDKKLIIRTEDTAIDIYSTPEEYDLSLKNAGSTTWSDTTKISETSTGNPAAVVSNADGIGDLFFATGYEKWTNGYIAQHVGIDKWTGTREVVQLVGKNQIADVFMGSDDANILVITDDTNGDALFVDDIYTTLPGTISEQQSRIAQINEIRSGAGDDIVDMTSQRFKYEGAGLIIRGGNGNDTIWSNNGDNKLFGDAGNDRIVGAAGNDIIVGGSGNDSMHGGGGSDIFCFCNDWGKDTVEQLADGTVTLWFESGSDDNWDQKTMTYTDGENSVKVCGISEISLKFGDDQSELYKTLVSMDAFADKTSEKIFEEKDKSLVVSQM